MTVIVAAQTKRDGVVIASDSQETWGYRKLNEQPEKLWVEEEYGYAFGACGSVRTAQVIRMHSDWPYMVPSQPLLDFAVKAVVPAVRRSTLDHGCQYQKRGLEMMDAAVIMAHGDSIMVIDMDYGIFIPISGRMAIGSGEAEALGYLGESGPWTKGDVIEAARRARISAYGVGGDIHVVTTKKLVVEKVDL